MKYILELNEVSFQMLNKIIKIQINCTSFALLKINRFSICMMNKFN